MIYNPAAGGLEFQRSRLPRAADILTKAGHHVALISTTGSGTAGAIAKQSILEGADLILAAGGDGTVNEVLDGLVHSPVPLGILPAGTANVLANELGLGSNLEKAAARIGECVPERISVGRLRCNAESRSRYFLLMAGIGLDAHIVYRVSATLKSRLGKIAYWIAGFSLLGRELEEFQVQAGKQTITCSFALVSKVRNYGGDLEIARDTSLLDDLFEVTLFSGRSSLRYLKYLAGLALKRLSGMSGVSVLRARQVRFSVSHDQRIYIQVDGEYAGHVPASVEIVPDALTLLIPPAYKNRIAAREGREGA